MDYIINALNAGEMSPLLDGRTDIQKYHSGCKTLENMVALSQGGVQRRPGTEYIATTKSNGEARLFSFVASTTESYVLEFGDSYIRFYTDGEQIQSGGSAYEIVSPYQVADLDAIRMVQLNDIAYVIHPSYSVRKLSRTGDTSWTLAEVDWTNIPYQAENITRNRMTIAFDPDNVTAWADATAYEFGDAVYIAGTTDANDKLFLTCVKEHTSDAATAALKPVEADFTAGALGLAVGQTDGYWYCYATDDDTGSFTYDDYIERGMTVNITLDDDYFEAGMVGTTFKVVHDFQHEVLAGTITANTSGTTGVIRVAGDWTFSTGGTWTAEVKIQRSVDYGLTWYDLRVFDSDNSNYSTSGTESDPNAFYRISYNKTAGTELDYNFNVSDPVWTGEVELTGLLEGAGTVLDGSSLSSYSDILAHYQCDDNAATATVSDTTTNYDATYNSGATATTDQISDAVNYKVDENDVLSFNLEADDSDYVQFPASLVTAIGSGSHTYSAWVRMESLASKRMLFSRSATNNYARIAVYVDSNGKVNFHANNSSTTKTGSTVLSTGTWYLVTYTYQTGTHTIYINGEKEFSVTPSISWVSSDSIYFGYQKNNGFYYDGNVDNILIYEKALSPSEILALYSASPTATGKIITPVKEVDSTPDGTSAPTRRWAEASWSTLRGYPSVGTLYEERLVLASNAYERGTVWMSQSSDYENFKEGPDDSDAISYTVASGENNEILWITSHDKIALGTTGGEFIMGATAINAPITPTNVECKRSSTYGSADVESAPMNDSTLYLQRNAKRMREYVYQYEKEGFVSNDLTIMASHILGSGARKIVLQQSPYSIAWVVRTDGVLSGLTLEKQHDVLAWHRHDFGGDVEDIAIIPGDTEDDAWLIVKRDIDGSTVRHIERMIVYGFDFPDEPVFTDSSLVVTSPYEAKDAGVTFENAWNEGNWNEGVVDL